MTIKIMPRDRLIYKGFRIKGQIDFLQQKKRKSSAEKEELKDLRQELLSIIAEIENLQSEEAMEV